MKTIINDNIKNEIVNIILEEISLKAYSIYIFGTYLEENKSNISGIKVVVVTSCKISIKDKYNLRQSLSENIRLNIELVVLSENDASSIMKILNGGYLLYERKDYGNIFDNMYEELEFDFYFMESYIEENEEFYK